MSKLRTFYYPHSVIPQETLKALALYFDEIIVQANTEFDSEDLELFADLPLLEQAIDKIPELYTNPNELGIFGEGFNAALVYLIGRYTLARFVDETEMLRDEGILTLEHLATLPKLKHKAFIALTETILHGVKDEDVINQVVSQSLAYGWVTKALIGDYLERPLKDPLVRNAAKANLVFQFSFIFAGSRLHGAVPISDNSLFKDLMDRVVAKCIRLPSEQSSLQSSLHVFNSVKSRLPSLHLCSYEDVLEARRMLNDELLEFRENIQVLTSHLQLGEIKTANEQDIQSIQRKIERDVASIESKVRRARNKFLRKVAEGLATASPPALVSTFYPNMPIASLAIAMGMAAAGKILDAFAEYKDTQGELKNEAHGVSYLLNISKKL